MIDRLVADLRGADHLARVRARDQLGDVDVDAVLERLWEDGGANALAEGVRLVASHRRAAWLDAVGALLDPPDKPVRVLKASVLCLGSLGDGSALPRIARLAEHDNDMLRRACVEAAGRLGGTEVLLGALADTAWQVRMYAAIGLGACPQSEVALGALFGAFDRESHPATAEQMVRSVAEVGGPEAVKALVGWLDDAAQPAVVRRAAARGLGELGRGRACARALDDPDGRVAEQALWAYQVSGGRRDQEP